MTLEQRIERIERHLGLSGEPEIPAPVASRGKVAVVVGHSRRGDRGATSAGGLSEWTYNRNVATFLSSALKQNGYEVLVISEIPEDTYPAAMTWAAQKIKQFGADLALELHFNASGSHQARGHEWLYWSSSRKGKRVAEAFETAMASRWAGPNRGTKAKGPGDRGAHFLSKTHCPAIICEPFFGDNQDDWVYWKNAGERLADIYAEAIESVLT